MKSQQLFTALMICLLCLTSFYSYDIKYVETKTYTSPDKEPYAIVKMNRKDGRVKVKYFASKNYDGTSVYQRYLNWSSNKNIITVSSGTYMTECDATIARPVGLCIDAGNVVNEGLSDNFDGLIIVYATGGMVASNLKDADLSITYKDGTNKKLDIKNNAWHRAEFLKWAKEEQATVFQTHLFVYKNQLKIGTNGSQKKSSRRFLAVCKDKADNVVHYIINLPDTQLGNYATTLYEGTVKAFNYLQKIEDVSSIIYMINLDPGCQNIFSVFDANGNMKNQTFGEHGVKLYQGDYPITNAANLLAYYYE
jgi:hypothetical protein